MKKHYYPAYFFHSKIKSTSDYYRKLAFYRLIKRHNIEFVNGEPPLKRLYSLKDWNQKVSDRYKILI